MEGNAPPKLSISELDDVRLIVKSANQQFDDLIVHSEPSWNIRKLKLHLSQVYPSNPTVPEQKLIYSGQLLSDELILKDILRSYKDVETENHIFHLVYTPKISATKPKLPESQPLLSNNKQQEQKPDKPITPVIPGSISSADGLRHRNVASSSTTSSTAPTSSNASEAPIAAANPTQIPNIAYPYSIPQAATAAAGCPTNYPNVTPFSFPGQFNNGAVTEQQAAMQNWVQQIYANYMEQCLKMANLTMNAAQMQSNAPSIPMFMPMMPQFMPSNFPTLQTTTPTAANSVPVIDGPGTSQAARAAFAPRVLPVIPPAAAQPGVAPTVGTTATPAAAPAPAPAENVVEQPQPQPRFPNIVQEEQDNRDWLDSFYSVTRLLALLTLVFFYSSPLRCLVVAIIAVGIYLYHTGFFQTRRQGQANNNNNNRNNNNQNINDNNAPAAAAGNAAAQDTPQAATEASQGTAGDSEPLISSSTPPEAETTTTSLIAFVRTFVVSFFASLLPETPAL
ncbi:homocysteine-responsive endoplasmic reticulum-resident ubiquitin-like domain member 2 protein [Episyrphus balteatus]|uniref:homocysteine-responsive endoplasmic reticulum-resident ubiquitin-like domain member 2 protein n=1 Tax=Episyrphus balteatus TaxID=286459 RepID=UPI0024851F4D|nr:homocysteine-responsive endoplasmic reticulum-resident ubiquitin-like domain member 2 protein [Episyrphus balteatus]